MEVNVGMTTKFNYHAASPLKLCIVQIVESKNNHIPQHFISRIP